MFGQQAEPRGGVAETPSDGEGLFVTEWRNRRFSREIAPLRTLRELWTKVLTMGIKDIVRYAGETGRPTVY